MPAVFLSGPMAWPPLVQVICGTLVKDLSLQNAALSGFAVRARDDRCFARLVPANGAMADGLLLADPDRDTLARIEFFAAALRHAPVEAEVDLDGRPVLARVFVSEGNDDSYDSDWNLARWQARWGALAIDAATELMGHRGHFSPQELPLRLPMILSRAAARQAAARGVPRNVRSDMTSAMVDNIAQTTPHAGFFLTRQHRLRHPGFDGGMSPAVTREVFVATDAAIVLPYDAARDRVLLVEQFRMGPYGRGDPYPWMLEPVAGRVDPGETPEQTARRECVEEAGLVLHGLEHIASYYCSPGCSTEYFHTYLGLCDLPEMARGQGGLDSEDEDIRTHVLSFEDAMALVSSGEADNGPLILSLIWLSGARKRLRSAA